MMDKTPDYTCLNRAEARELGTFIWGKRWPVHLAKALGIKPTVVRTWLSEDILPPYVTAYMIHILEFMPSDDRPGEACAARLARHLARLVSLAEAAGWPRDDVVSSILMLAVSNMISSDGRERTIAMLDQIREVIDDL